MLSEIYASLSSLLLEIFGVGASSTASFWVYGLSLLGTTVLVGLPFYIVYRVVRAFL